MSTNEAELRISKAKQEAERRKKEVLAGSYPALYFPQDLQSVPYYMIFTPIKYNRKTSLSKEQIKQLNVSEGGNLENPLDNFAGVFSGVNRGSIPKTPASKTELEKGGIIALPLPSQLSESLSIGFDTIDMGIAAAGFQAGQSIGRGEFDLDTALDAGAYAARSLAGLSEQFGQLVNLMAGDVPNPYSVTSFKRVEQREFPFEWTFAPRNQKESELVREIVNTFRYLSLPEQDGMFLEFPHEWEIQFVGTNFLYSMSRGYIHNLKIDFGSQNGISFFPIGENDGAPTQVKFSFTFKEIFPLDKKLIRTPRKDSAANISMLPSDGIVSATNDELRKQQEVAKIDEELAQTVNDIKAEEAKKSNDLWQTNNFAPDGGIPGGA